MTTLSAFDASKQLPELLNVLAESHEVVQITGSQHSAMLVSEDDWVARFKRRSTSPRFRA